MFVKLFGSILNSSVWMEDAATRIVWITMLVKADEDGFVQGVEKALARDAGVTPEECAAALDILSSPDPHSQTPDNEGRRIERVEGGWMVLNYLKYREIRTRQQVKEANKKRRQRSKHKEGDVSGDGGDMSPVSPPYASPSVSDSVVSSSEAVHKFDNDDHQASYLRLRSESRSPLAFDGALRGINQGMGGPAYDWPIIGQALVELEANGRTFNAASLRAFCQKLKATAPISDEERMKPLENGVF